MNSIRKLVEPGLALLKRSRLSLDTTIRAINSSGNSAQLASSITNQTVENGLFGTKFTPQDIEFTFNSSGTVAQARKLFPYAWLRDNCRCAKCYNYVADEIERDLHSLSSDLRPSHLKSLATPNGHNSNKIELTCKTVRA